MPGEPTTFGARVKELREERNWSQPQLAQRAEISAGYVAGIETGARGRRPSRDVVLQLARAFDVNPVELLTFARRDEPADHEKQRQPRPTVRDALMRDTALLDSEKEMLLRLYESYVTKRRTARRP